MDFVNPLTSSFSFFTQLGKLSMFRSNKPSDLRNLMGDIHKYRSMDFQTSPIDELERLIGRIINDYKTQSFFWGLPVIYRARKHDACGLIFKNTEQLIYPKKENVKKLGRLNGVGESMFYCASDKDTALLEVRPKFGDEITILESRLIDSVKIPEFAEVGIREVMIQQNHSPEFTRQNIEMLNKALKTRDDKKRYVLAHDFLVGEMTKIVEDDKICQYNGTIVIGRFIMNNLRKPKPVDGMVYRSISRIGAECIALKPDSYDLHYKPDRCFKVNPNNA